MDLLVPEREMEPTVEGIEVTRRGHRVVMSSTGGDPIAGECPVKTTQGLGTGLIVVGMRLDPTPHVRAEDVVTDPVKEVARHPTVLGSHHPAGALLQQHLGDLHRAIGRVLEANRQKRLGRAVTAMTRGKQRRRVL